MQQKGRLELTWVSKYEEPNIEPRILVEDKSKSYGGPPSGNMLIHGDNPVALQALQQNFDNINAANGQYDDNIANSE